MGRRIRRVGTYAPRKQFIYENLDELLSLETIPEGVHTVRYGPMVGDLLYDERPDSSVLLVYFSAAIASTTTWPMFSGVGSAARAGTSLLAFSDPSVALDNTISTGWTLGDHRHQYHQDVPSIIKKFAGDRAVILVGASAGGFPALHYGAQLPESYSVVINPRTHLLAPPTLLETSFMRRYGGRKIREVVEEIPVKPDRPGNTVLYLQNSGDHRYFSGHLIPYLQRLPEQHRVFVYLDHWGDGHVPMPKYELADLLKALIEDPDKLLSGMSLFSSIDEVYLRHAELSLALTAR